MQVRVRGAAVDVALVQALADVLRGFRKVHGLWLGRPALGPGCKDEVDLAVAMAGRLEGYLRGSGNYM